MVSQAGRGDVPAPGVRTPVFPLLCAALGVVATVACGESAAGDVTDADAREVGSSGPNDGGSDKSDRPPPQMDSAGDKTDAPGAIDQTADQLADQTSDRVADQSPGGACSSEPFLGPCACSGGCPDGCVRVCPQQGVDGFCRDPVNGQCACGVVLDDRCTKPNARCLCPGCGDGPGLCVTSTQEAALCAGPFKERFLCP